VIDSASALPLYHQVAGVLRQRIADGFYPEGGRLVSEDELATEFAVSRATIRQAIGQLVVEGLVVRKQGSGTFVQHRDPAVLQQRFRGSLGDLIKESHDARARDLEVVHDQRIPDRIASVMQLDRPTGTVVRRTRIMGGMPFAYTITHLPGDLGAVVTKTELRKRALMEILVEHGTQLASASQSIRAQLADPEVGAKIEVELGSPVLYVERIVNDVAGRAVEFVQSWYRGDRYEYAVTLDLAMAGDERGVYHNLA